MSTPFQNRLVGTVIVAAAVIIFLPNLLDGKKKSNQTEFDEIPQTPAFTGKINTKSFPEQKLVIKDKATVLNEQAQDDLLKIDNTVKTSKESSSKITIGTGENKSTKVTPASKVQKIVAKTQSAIIKPVLGQQPAQAVNKEAWVIQLGSFKHKSNVAELVAKLKHTAIPLLPDQLKQNKVL